MSIQGLEEDNSRKIGKPFIKRQIIFQARPCVTPDRQPGICSAIARCPQLMLDLNRLRRSVCMQNLIVLGVCCPVVQVCIIFKFKYQPE
ncbi:CLIP domain-containing protein [Trichonephila clavata]|uniref:CLIP domain-containing protein n=1 Tax=Trichonephila clavata TaxID=2740835 RepID=A0A8X6FXD8_TRICU|nr:CLIP domain-containing protein [Trichonephila clavata]